MANHRPVVLVHGYSDSHKGFDTWRSLLTDRASTPVFDVRVGSYESLTNEISIKDIAEAFDRALRQQAGLSADEEFDAIVHSTGMLVVRAWLTTYSRRMSRLKHLVALAPATWGSPIAHKGRSWLGSVFKGSKNPFKPDFLEAGDGVLDGLELGSRFTWDLAHLDLFGDEVYYGPDQSTPYVFIFCGNKGYEGIRELVNEPGTDGTVRLAGASLNSRKAVVDLTERSDVTTRVRFTDWKGASDLPVILVDGVNHGTIMSKPPESLVRLVRSALQVEDKAGLAAWLDDARATSAEPAMKRQWQQFILRLTDERGDPIPDYNVRLFEGGRELRVFTADVHAYSRDKSLRNFHVDVTELAGRRVVDFRMKLIASSGTALVGYVGYGSGQSDTPEPMMEVELDMSDIANGPTTFFFPFTTTLVEMRLNREPLPIGGGSRLCRIYP